MVSPKFVSSLGLHIEPIPQESPNFIQLGHSSSRTSRNGHVFISIYYKKVLVKHKFEVFDIFTTINNANIPCLIGLDIMSKLNIGITDHWFGFIPL